MTTKTTILILALAQKAYFMHKINFYNFSPKLHTVQKIYVHCYLTNIYYIFMWAALCLNAFHDIQVRWGLQAKRLTATFSLTLSYQVQYSFSRNNFKFPVLWGCQPDFNFGIILYCPGMGESNFFHTTEL